MRDPDKSEAIELLEEELRRERAKSALVSEKLRQFLSLKAGKLDLQLPKEFFDPANGYAPGDEKAPFFSEAFLYNLLGKEGARSLLGYLGPVMRVAGLRKSEKFGDYADAVARFEKAMRDLADVEFADTYEEATPEEREADKARGPRSRLVTTRTYQLLWREVREARKAIDNSWEGPIVDDPESTP